MAIKSPNWSDIEHSPNTAYFVEYLDTVTAQTEIQRYKHKTYQLLNIEPGHTILDVGCGTGDDVLALAKLIGSEGKVVGLDSSQSIVSEAQQRHQQSNLPIVFQTGDVHTLTFADNTFDSCRADRIFMHLENPAQALSEMVRVVRPGGRIVLREPDWDTLVVDHPDHILTRTIVQHHFDRVIRHPWSGRELYRLCSEAYLVNINVADTSTLVLTDFATANQLYGLDAAVRAIQAQETALHTQAEAWLAYLKQADEKGCFFSAVTGFTVVGQKPLI